MVLGILAADAVDEDEPVGCLVDSAGLDLVAFRFAVGIAFGVDLVFFRLEAVAKLLLLDLYNNWVLLDGLLLLISPFVLLENFIFGMGGASVGGRG